MEVERDRHDWRAPNMSTLMLALVRGVKDPALAWDIAGEAMAAASLEWHAFPGGSRMAWVLAYAQRVLDDASRQRRVSSRARERNGASKPSTLGGAELSLLTELSTEPLQLDADASAVIDAIARDGPPPGVRESIALSPLTRRGPSPERVDG